MMIDTKEIYLIAGVLSLISLALLLIGKWFMKISREVSNPDTNSVYAFFHDEFSAPLHRLHTFLDAIPIKLENQSEEISDDLKQMRTDVKKLEEVTGTLRTIFRIDILDEDRTLHRIDLADIAQELVLEYTDIADSFDVLVEYSGEPRGAHVLGKESEMKRIIGNLIDNAIKYRRDDVANSRVLVSVKTTRRHVRVSISDNGQGMSSKTKKALGKQPTKGNIRSDGSKGSGVGHYLIKRLLAKNRGKMSIDSELGNGTTIVVRFPLSGKQSKP